MKRTIHISILLLVFVTCCIGQFSHAGLLPTTSTIYTPIAGTPVVIGNPEAYTVVTRQVPSGSSHIDRLIQGVVTFGVDHHYPTYFTSMDIEIELEVKRWSDATLGSPDMTDTTLIMKISYSPEDSLSFRDKQSILLKGVEKYSIEIMDIQVNGSTVTTLPANLYINASMFVDRYYDFSSAAVTPVDVITTGEIDSDNLIDSDCDGHYDELLLTWDTIESAEEYQLEWVYINDYDTIGGYYDDDDLAYDFRHNSTRISTSQTEYKVSLAYDRGYICYRVRAIGRATTDLTKRIFGVWTEPDAGTVDGTNYYFKNYAWSDTLNWQFSATYAEEGKKKEVVGFFDGTQRNRQNVTKINSDHNTIVGETIYDHQGRPVIQVLPTPVLGLDCENPDEETSLKYYHNFTQNEEGDPYSRLDFDLSDSLTPCVAAADSMGIGNGASRYYSSSNPDHSQEQAFVPDAAHYPFSQVEYTPDNTGRIRRQGGVGEDFQLGSGHEMHYYYGHPSQLQLDRMFGSEVGDKAHYQKNMVVDPNGQISVSYVDQEGRVIATSLAGDAPSNLRALSSESEAAVEVTEDLFGTDAAGNSTANHLTADGSERIFSETILVAGNTDVEFNYDLQTSPFMDTCLNEDICFSCVYDLTIKVYDECGVDQVAESETIIPTMTGFFVQDPETEEIYFTTDCDSIAEFDFPEQSFTLSLTTGSYQVVKSLRINEAAKERYVQAYLDTNLNHCIRSLEDFEQEYLNNTDFSDCLPETDCDSCLADLGTLEAFITGGGTVEEYQTRQEFCDQLCHDVSPCEVIKEMMLTDMSPGGQYGEYVTPSNVINPSIFNLSIYNSSNILPYSVSTTQIDWRNPRLIIDGTTINEYREEDGSTRSRIIVQATVNSSGVPTASDPPVDSPSTEVFFDATIGEYYTYPENLTNVVDFIGKWKASWANSLLSYHPEYSFYKTCVEFDEKIDPDDEFTSDSFDNLLRKTDTWDEAIAAGFIKSNYNTFPNVNDRVTDWFSVTSPAWDPFVVHLAEYDNYGADLEDKFTNYQVMGGGTFTMVELAAYGARCTNGIGYYPAPSCLRFGDDADPGGDPDYNDSIRNVEWGNLRSFYLSAKQTIQQELSIDRSINNSSYLGYNGCIGNLNFNPLEHNFYDGGVSPSASAYFINDHPCYIATKDYYKYKVKRFQVPLDNLNPDPHYVSYQNYLLTGQCPVTNTLQQLLTELAAVDSLDEDGTLLLNKSTFAGFYLALHDFYLSAPIPDHTWEVTTLTSSQIIADVVETGGPTVIGTVQIDIPGGLPAFTWGDITSFMNLDYTSGTNDFTIDAIVDTTGGTMQVTLTGTTDFDIADCHFNEMCTPNELAIDLGILIDRLAYNGDLNSTTAVQLKGGSSPYEPLVTLAIENAAFGGPASTLYWVYNSASTTFRIYESNPSVLRLELKINDVDPVTFPLTSLNLIKGITEIIPTQSNTFDMICEDASGDYLVTLKCHAILNDPVSPGTWKISLGECDLPVSVLCDGPTYANAEELEALLHDIILNQSSSPGYDLFASPAMTTNLMTYFPPGTDTTYSTVEDTVIGDIHYQIITIYTGYEDCPLVITISDDQDPELSIDDIVTPYNLVPYGEPEANGAYYNYYMTAYFNVSHVTVTDTLFISSCIPINLCSDCPDSIPVLADTLTEEEMMMELSMGRMLYDPSPEMYRSYMSAIDSLNARMSWEETDSGFVEPVTYETYVQRGMRYYSEAYARYIFQFDPELDTAAYLYDPELFVKERGYYINVVLEYRRYLAAVNRFNLAAPGVGLDTLQPVSDSVFAHNRYEADLGTYVPYLITAIAEVDSAMGIEAYHDESGGMLSLFSLSEEDCEALYDDYVDAYVYFYLHQTLVEYTCLNFMVHAPLLTYTEFQDHNLCCSEYGVSIVEDYIELLLSDTLCPDALPALTSCEEPEINDTIGCHTFWLISYPNALDLYNNSDWATYHDTSLTNDYSNFSLFVATGKCDCVKSYANYLYTWMIADSLDELPYPMTLDEYCDSVPLDPEPDPCAETYKQYLDCITGYNAWAIANEQTEITTYYTFEAFVENELCYCVDIYCSILNDAINGFYTPSRVPTYDFKEACDEATTPPCTPDLPGGNHPFPTEVFVDPCAEFLTGIAYANAYNAYQNYLDSITQLIGLQYQEHCMSATETFSRTYMDKEYHRTLYYYDQAGNLIKTVPPEGVKLLPITDEYGSLADSVKTDRLNGTHLVLTNHYLASTYEYNSLNQLVRQSTPDQDQMDIWEITLPNGLYAGLSTSAIQMITPNTGYLSGTIELASGVKRGLLYRTENGGANWTKVHNTVAATMKRVAMADDDIGFAVGEYGVALQTIDGGITWDMLNLYSLGVTGQLNDVVMTTSTAGRFVGEGATVIDVSLSGAVATPSSGTLSVPASMSGQSIVRLKSVVYTGSDYYYAATMLDGSDEYDAVLTGSSLATTTAVSLLGIHNRSIHYYSATEAIVMGDDGDIVQLYTPASGTAFVQTARKSGLTYAAKQAYFLSANRGIGLFNTGSNTAGYYTVNGGKDWISLPELDGYKHLSLVEQTASHLEVLGVGDDARTRRFFWNTTAAEPALMEHTNLANPQTIDLVTSTLIHDSYGPTLVLAGASNGKIYVSNNLPTGTEPVVYTEIAQLNGSNPSETAVKITVYRFSSGAVSGVIVSSQGLLYSIHRNAGSSTFSIASISSGVTSPTFIDLALDVADTRIYAFDNTDDQLHKMTLSASTPVSSTTVFTTPALSPNAGVTAMAVSNGRVTVTGASGMITTTDDVSGANTLSTWSARNELRMIPINDLDVISGSNLIGVGDNGLVMYTGTGGMYLKKMAALDDLYAAKTVGSVQLVAGANGFLQQMTSAPTHLALVTTGGITVQQQFPDVDLHDIAVNSTYTYVAGTNGTVLFSADPASLPFATTSGQHQFDFYCAVIPTGQSGTPKAIVGGNHAGMFRFQAVNGTQQKGVFSNELYDVHFANTSTGSVVGKNFFVRQTFDGGLTWKLVMPSNSVSTQLGSTITEVWTMPNNGYAILAGANYTAYADGGLSYYTFFPYTIRDIEFSDNSPLFGAMASSDGKIYSITLTPSGSSYTSSGGLITSTGAGHILHALHVFENGNIMAVGKDNFVGMWKTTAGGGWEDFSPSVTATPNPTFRDVFFHDDVVGYLVGDEGVLLRSKDVTIDAATHRITAIDFELKNVLDDIIGDEDEADLTCIDFGSRYEGVWGGNYTGNISVPDQDNTAYVRRIHDESGDFSGRFFYDRLGRIVVSQNARQYGAGEFSYLLYDALGRVYEAGVKTENDGGDPQFSSIFGTYVGGQFIPTVVDDTHLATWLNNDATTTRTEVTRSYYDETVITGLPATFTPNELTQRKRITHVTYEAVFDNDDQTYDHATHYDYDIHGNVATLLQDNPKLAALDADLAEQQFKRLDYNYDLISGNVHRASYQTTEADQWHHAYEYDADNRLTQAYTSTATPLMDPQFGQTASQQEPEQTPYWYSEARYRYYDHGPLARTELGEEKVQGTDYIYTLQGWIKGVNSNTLYADRDPGLDGDIGSWNEQVARDAYSYSLHYFTDDYKGIDAVADDVYADQTGGSIAFMSQDLYNGNIARMVTTITNPTTRSVLPLGNMYGYDQLNRFLGSVSYTNLNLAGNDWGSFVPPIYYNAFGYDANGNILTQTRYDNTLTVIDQLTYNYERDGDGQLLRNRLYHLNDAATAGTFPDDIDDQGTFDGTSAGINVNNNYVYDAEGRLTKDVQEEIDTILWRTDGKVLKISRPGASTRKNLTFDYDAFGRRIAKHVFTATDILERSTYYVLDATGNVMAVYEHEVDEEANPVAFYLNERHLYGSGKLGLLRDSIELLGALNDTFDMQLVNHRIGQISYELTNHLGNVLSTISDKPIPHDNSGTVDYWLADIRTAQDYSGFGVTLEGRDYALAGAEKDRYGFQGQEADDEIKGEGNSYNYTYRMHDPRIGRFFAIDPLAPKYPYYTPYQFSGNRPIDCVELEGLEPGSTEIGSSYGQRTVAQDGNTLEWRWYEWQKTSSDIDKWVDVGGVELVYDFNNSRDMHLPTVNTTVDSWYVDNTGDQLIDLGGGILNPADPWDVSVFTINGSEYRAKYDEYNDCIGYWDSNGGKFSGVVNEDGSYAGNIFETNAIKDLAFDNVKALKLTNLQKSQILSGARDGVIKDLALEGIYASLGASVPATLPDFSAGHDAILDVQIETSLYLAGPGSRVYVPLSPIVSPFEMNVYDVFLFHGYMDDGTPYIQVTREETVGVLGPQLAKEDIDSSR